MKNNIDIKQEFLGEVNGVPVKCSGTFSTVEWFMYELEDLDLEETINNDLTELSREVIIGTERTEYKVEYFSRAELENDLYYMIENLRDEDYIAPLYFDRVLEILRTHVKKS